MKPLSELCVPRASVFEYAGKDTVYDLSDLDSLNAVDFFAENHVTEGMKTLLREAFTRLERRAPGTPGAFLLSQSMGGGKTHNLLALGLLARRPDLRRQVTGSFYEPGPLGAVRTVAFTGRQTKTPYGIWGEIAGQLNRLDAFKDLYSPLRPPGVDEWVALLRGEPLLVLLDELPAYFEAARGISVGATNLAALTTTALANLLVAVGEDKLPNACVVLTDLRGSAYAAGSQAIGDALANLEQEASKFVMRIDPVRLNTNEVYDILRVRLFEKLPPETDRQLVADEYSQALDAGVKMGFTTRSPAALRDDVSGAYPFHPAARDLFARFRENQGYQQTRALIRIMRLVVADLWNGGSAKDSALVGPEHLDLHNAALMSEIRQINGKLENAIAHDLCDETRTAVSEVISAELGSRDATDAATVLLLSSLSLAVNPTLGLTRDELNAYLARPGRDLARLRDAIDRLQQDAWYLHPTSDNRLVFRDTENLVAKLDSYTRGYQREQAEGELRDRLGTLYEPKLGQLYQEVSALPALDQVALARDRVRLVIYRPTVTASTEIADYWQHQQWQNRVIFLTGTPEQYDTLLLRARQLKAIRAILAELRAEGRLAADPQRQEAESQETALEGKFYYACRETFQTLRYPTGEGLLEVALDPHYTESKFSGEQAVVDQLTNQYKYVADTGAEGRLRSLVEAKLWPAGLSEIRWADLLQRAASNPAWTFTHPRALESLRDEMVKRDLWRLAGDFVQRGPFEVPPPTVDIQEMSRDEITGKARLRIRVSHGDAVVWSESAPPTDVSPRLDNYELETIRPRLWFRALDTKDSSRVGLVREWTARVTIKYKLLTVGNIRRCELQALPGGSISYTTNGSSPKSSGIRYDGPFEVPKSARMVLAIADFEGVLSAEARFDLPEDGHEGPLIDLKRSATWSHSHELPDTAAVFTWLDQAVAHRAQLAGIDLNVQRDRRFVNLSADRDQHRPAEVVREWAVQLKDLLPDGAVTLTVESCRFETGADLTSFAQAIKVGPTAGEVAQ